MDFVLAKNAQDNPGTCGYKIVKRGDVERLPEPEIQAAWERILRDKGKEAWLQKIMPSEAVRARARELAEGGAALRKMALGNALDLRGVGGRVGTGAGTGKGQKSPEAPEVTLPDIKSNPNIKAVGSKHKQ